MLRKILLFFIAFILCGAVGSAQDKRTEYEELVDYVNCYYVRAYIQKKYSTYNDRLKKYYTDNDDKLNKATDYLQIEKVIDSKHAQAKKLCNEINNKKEKFDENWTKEKMIEFLILLEGRFKFFLDASTKSLKTDLEKQIPDGLFAKGSGENPPASSEAENGSSANNMLTVPVDGKSATETAGSSLSFRNFLLLISIIGLLACSIIRWKFWDKLKGNRKWKNIFYYTAIAFVIIILSVLFEPIRRIVYIAIGILVASFVIYYLWEKQKNRKSTTKHKISPSKNDIQQTKKAIEYQDISTQKDTQQLKKLNDRIKELKNENRRLQDRKITIDQLKKLVREQVQNNSDFKNFVKSLFTDDDVPKNQELPIKQESVSQNSNTPPSHSNSDVKNTSILYADAIIEDFFNRVTEEPNANTIFELNMQSAENCTFTIYTAAHPRIIANPSFLEGCKKQVLNNTRIVEIQSKGEAQRQVDGKWKITKKLNVIIN